MSNYDPTPKNPPGALREVPVDWEALEDAFENNAPEVHSYLHLSTGDVLRVVDGVADPQMHARINVDTNYLRIAPVSSREQYRWMERYIPMVEEPELRAKLAASIDGKGAFRRFKDVLMSHGVERERWFNFRSERLRTFMEAWLVAHALKPIPRPVWATSPEEGGENPEQTEGSTVSEDSSTPTSSPPVPSAEARELRRARNLEALRKHCRELIDALGPRDLEALSAFAEFLKARRIARSYAHHADSIDHSVHSELREGASEAPSEDAPPVSSELDAVDHEPREPGSELQPASGEAGSLEARS
jgi:hypothetical protein